MCDNDKVVPRYIVEGVQNVTGLDLVRLRLAVPFVVREVSLQEILTCRKILVVFSRPWLSILLG